MKNKETYACMRCNQTKENSLKIGMEEVKLALFADMIEHLATPRSSIEKQRISEFSTLSRYMIKIAFMYTNNQQWDLIKDILNSNGHQKKVNA